MSKNKSQEILQLCDDWRAAHVRPDGSGVDNDTTKALRLIANGIRFHELEFDELEAACVGLTETMVPRGLGGFICPDHQQFWGWCSQLFLTAPFQSVVPTGGDHIHQLLDVCACLLMGGKSHKWAPWEIKRSKGFDWCLHRLISQNLFVLKFLAYPLLESLLKVHCKDFVQTDGIVTKHFSVLPRNGEKQTYKPGKRCSIRDLFILLEQSAAWPELSGSLQRLENHFKRLDPNTAFLDLVYKWRNATLHGTGEITAVSGTVYNLCLLLCLHLVQPNYSTLQQAAIETVSRCKVAKFNMQPIYYLDI